MQERETVYTLALNYTKGLGVVNTKKIIQHFGSAENAWNLSRKEVSGIKGMTKKAFEDYANPNNLELALKELERNEQLNIHAMQFMQDCYPERLQNTTDCPPILFARGTVELPEKMVAIVGTRKMSRYGKNFIQKLMEDLAGLDVGIISGLALGCDAAAHKCALENGLKTFGVLANHVGEVKPKANAKIGHDLLQSGGAIFSEFSSFHKTEPINFIRRNRIIAGMADVTIIVESDYKGGSMSTARYANNYNREVMAVPGDLGRQNSNGCNHLIATHQAFLIRSADDLLYHLNLKSPDKQQPQKELFIQLEPDEQEIYDLLQKKGKLQVDAIAEQLNKPTYLILNSLLQMEIKDIIKPIPGKYFSIM